MKTINSINIELKKIFNGISFYISVLIKTILCFTSVVFVTSSQSFSVINAWLTVDNNIIKSNITFSSFNIFLCGSGSWLSMFIPMVAAFPFVSLFCDEKSGGAIRISIVRQGRRRYNLSKYISGIVSGGCAVALGYIIYGVIVYVMFPSLSQYNCTDIFTKYGISVVIIGKIFSMFLYGILSSIMALLFSSFIRNKYLILCIPFMLKYIYDQSIVKVISKQTVPSKKLTLMQTDIINQITEMPKFFLWYSSFILVLVIMCFVIYSFSMNRRLDLGA